MKKHGMEYLFKNDVPDKFDKDYFFKFMEDNINISSNVKKIAYLIEKNMAGERITEIINEAQDERKKGNCIYVSFMAKNKKFQKENLAKLGFVEFKDYYIERG